MSKSLKQIMAEKKAQRELANASSHNNITPANIFQPPSSTTISPSSYMPPTQEVHCQPSSTSSTSGFSESSSGIIGAGRGKLLLNLKKRQAEERAKSSMVTVDTRSDFSSSPSPPLQPSPQTVALPHHHDSSGYESHSPPPPPQSADDCASSVSTRVGSRVSALADDLSTLTIDSSLKKGQAGVPINLVINYLRMKTLDQMFFQYAVNFKPEIDSPYLRRRLISSQRSELSRFVFDGSTLYVTKSLGKRREFVVERTSDQTKVTVTVTLVRPLGPNHPQSCQLLNIMFNKIMRILQYKVEKKAAFLTSAPIKMNQYNLEIWAGYVTHVTPLDGGLMLLCDVSHRVVRNDTILDMMMSIKQRKAKSFEDFKVLCVKEFVGQVVLTSYNKKSYRVDDIDWNMKPTDTFDRNGTNMSFVDYYKNEIMVEVTDPLQPMLVSRPKTKKGSTVGILSMAPRV